MRTNREAVQYVNVIPGRLPAKKGQHAMSAKKELENQLTKDSNSPDSNSENISPTNRRKQRIITEPQALHKRKVTIPKATGRKLRGKLNAENNSSTTSEPETSSNLDHSGINESLEQSQSKEESLLGIESNSNGNDESQRQFENIQENPRIPKATGRKLRRKLNAENNSSTTAEPESSSNLDHSGISESLEQSKSKEGPSLSIESNANGNDESQRQSENIQETPNSSVISDSDGNGSSRKLRSSRKLLQSAEDKANVENMQFDGTSDSAALDDSKVQNKADDIDNVVAFIPKDDEFDKSTKLDDRLLVEVKQEDTNTEISVVHEEKEEDIPMPIPIININSPSAVSVDSAKGSSIANDSDSGTVFASGDLYWGRIHHFSYWACMICPDDSDEDNLITRLNDQQMEVHVRFFADNARHNWVKRENLISYQGLECYREHLRELKEKFGVKSIKYQSFLPKKLQLKTWLDAVREADIIATIPYPERLAKFFQLNDAARERNKEERMRRKSMSLSQSSKMTNNSTEQSDQVTNIAKKRNRSESPVSPAFSPIRKTKRRKTTADATEFHRTHQQNSIDEKPRSTFSETAIKTEYKTSQESSRSNNTELFDTPIFQQFHDIMKDYVMEGFQSEFVEQNLFVAVKNIWALKTILYKQFENIDQSMRENLNEEQSRKRLSLRLKELQQRQKTEATTTTSPMTSTMQNTLERRRLNSTSKLKKATRPIEEVIDDIFNLDNRYLFDNMSRDPVCKYCDQSGGELKRCSKGCFDWLHRDCLHTESIPSLETTPKKGKSKTTASIVKRRSTKKETIVSPTAPPAILSQLHVTADTDENDNENVAVVKIDSASDEKLPDTSLVKEHTTETIVCKECANNELPKCFICHASDKQCLSSNGEMEKENVIACNMVHCARVYHPTCLKYWPQSKITMSKNSIVSLRCPSHVCHTCVSDDPKGKFQHLNNANTTKCTKCPATYHMDSTCIPAGSEILTAAHIICPRHTTSKTDQNVNVSWCFICVRGGQLICCETCPTAVHAECSNIALDPNESYICDECESGRMPLYGEMVWAKFNAYRWWPAIILPPTEVPLNIRNKAHNQFEFVIRFFGTHDHGWISRRRVYLYLEGDWSEQPRSRKGIDQHYLRGVIEAKEAYEIIKAKALIRVGENEGKEKLHPQPYVKIRVNRAVPPVKLHPVLEKVGKCDCHPDEENPCGPDSNCLNRVLYHECNPKICPAGQRCQNQMFEARISPSLEIFYAKKERGFGLRNREAITAGTFIIEYVGEVIDSAEFDRRMQQKSTDRDENYYFLYVEKDYIIDAGPKGNMARFMNHSCNPNCETQKWSVNGLNRVGLFAIKDIPADTELTFNYHWDELLGNDRKVCYCGSEDCTGQIGKVSKEIKFKQLNTDEQPLSANAKNSKIDQSKMAKTRKRRKNNTSKLLHQKRNKSDAQISSKPKIVRKKRQEVNGTTESNESKITN